MVNRTREAAQDTPPVAVRREHVPDGEVPQTGDTVWFKHWNHDYLRAAVVDGIRDTDNQGQTVVYPPARDGRLHLRIELVPHRHHSANTFGYRKDVVEGHDIGQWLREPPSNWQAAKERHDTEQEMLRTVRLEAMSEQAGAGGDRPRTIFT